MNQPARDLAAGYAVRDRRVPVAREEYALKRIFDVGLAGLALLISLPLWVLFAIAIKIEDGGSVFYRQKRIGQGGRSFGILKFRTLVANADREVRPWMNPGEQWVTRVGRILRATALDELPQLFNIVKGEMSFVGPRAMPVEEFQGLANKLPGLKERCRVRPGLTGLAQVYGKATRDARKKLRYELIYIQNQSFWLDLKLIVLSFGITFRGKWESRGKKF